MIGQVNTILATELKHTLNIIGQVNTILATELKHILKMIGQVNTILATDLPSSYYCCKIDARPPLHYINICVSKALFNVQLTNETVYTTEPYLQVHFTGCPSSNISNMIAWTTRPANVIGKCLLGLNVFNLMKYKLLQIYDHGVSLWLHIP